MIFPTATWADGRRVGTGTHPVYGAAPFKTFCTAAKSLAGQRRAQSLVMTEIEMDRWAKWLLQTRSGGDPETRARMVEFLAPVRDRVLAAARIRAGDTVLDVGAGDGLIAFGALEFVGTTGSVILGDVSIDLLRHSATLTPCSNDNDRCWFLGLSADRLPIADDTVDVITTRSVLIYLPARNKRLALAEFRRVLRTGGRISLFEPINSFAFPEPEDRWHGFDVTPVKNIATKLARVNAGGANSAHPLLDFDERDLLEWLEAAGFSQTRLDYEVEIGPDDTSSDDWETFLRSASNPLDPSPDEAMKEHLTRRERTIFVDHVRPLFERGERRKRSAVAYLSAVK
jgi:arsenite methyltransferase